MWRAFTYSIELMRGGYVLFTSPTTGYRARTAEHVLRDLLGEHFAESVSEPDRLTIARELIASAKIIRCPGVYGSDWAIHDSGEHSVRLDIGELDAAVTVTAREVVG